MWFIFVAYFATKSVIDVNSSYGQFSTFGACERERHLIDRSHGTQISVGAIPLKFTVCKRSALVVGHGNVVQRNTIPDDRPLVRGDNNVVQDNVIIP